jgi:hypothetical protein
MKTQYDGSSRVVAVENLAAMCRRVSGMCHRYWIESVSRSRVAVGYSNPDEYGSESPMFAVFPCIPNPFDSKEHENPFVILTGPGSILRVVNDTWNGEGWQAFDPLCDAPVLWRSPEDGSWSTKEEIEARKAVGS